MKELSLKNAIKGAKYKTNKRCLSADGFSLLPSALRPRLFWFVLIAAMSFMVNLEWLDSCSFAIDPTISVNIANSISLDLKPISNTGTFATSSTADNTVSVSTNYFAGYTLSIAASTENDNALKYIENGNVLATIPSHTIAAGVSATNYADDTYAETNELNNTWGYRPSKYNSVDNTVTNYYYPGPTVASTSSIVLDSTNVANPSTANNYNIAIGARVDMDAPKGLYTNTFVMQIVANPIPYTITYDENTEETVTNMPTNESSAAQGGVAIISNTIPVRSGYIFEGWCTVAVADGETCDSPNVEYAAGGSYTLDQVNGGNNLALYAMWKGTTVTFKVGSNIDTIIVADSSQNYKPFYATADADAIFNGAVMGTKYIVTVVPEAGYMLSSWYREDAAGDGTDGVGDLASDTLLTTTYTVGEDDETLTAEGDYLDGSYNTMQDMLATDCFKSPNLVDERDEKSYTVATFVDGDTTYCYMLSNIRLDGGTTLYASDGLSNVTADYTLPVNTDSMENGWLDDYCRPYMAIKNNEYYYNWPAATARTNSTVGVSYCGNDISNSVGDICPAGWHLANIGDIPMVPSLWDDGENPGMLVTSGGFSSGSQVYLGIFGAWWSGVRKNNLSAYVLVFDGTKIGVVSNSAASKMSGGSVRCMMSDS